MSTPRKRFINLILSSVHQSGFWKIKQKAFPNVLTVLNYHRVFPWRDDSSFTFKPNLSAAPEMFSSQMDYLKENFNVVSEEDVIRWLNGEDKLPPQAALITFDDGYLDNYQYAYPVLKERNLSAIIFLTTNFLDQKLIFYWDLAAYIIYKAKRKSFKVAGFGEYTWQNGNEDKVIHQFVNELKYLPEEDKWSILEESGKILGVEIDKSYFHQSAMTWEQVVEMNKNGIDFGAHTVNHPILSKIPEEQALFEILESKKRIENILGTQVNSIAYPNGQKGDFTSQTIDLVRENDYQLAFSLISGPGSYQEAKRERFEIRRIFLSHKDNLPKFIAKVNGLARYM